MRDRRLMLLLSAGAALALVACGAESGEPAAAKRDVNLENPTVEDLVASCAVDGMRVSECECGVQKTQEAGQLDAPVIRMLVRQEHGLEMDDTDAENLQSFNDQQLRAFNSFNVVHMPSCLED